MPVVSAGPQSWEHGQAHFGLWLDRQAVSGGQGHPLGKWVGWAKGRPPVLAPHSFLSDVHSCDLWEPARPHFLSFLLPPVVTGPGCCSQPWGGIHKAASPQEAIPLLWIAFAGPFQFGSNPLPARKQDATRSPCYWAIPCLWALVGGGRERAEPPGSAGLGHQRVRHLGECGRPAVVLKWPGSCCM